MFCERIYKTHFEAAHFIDPKRIKTDECHQVHGHGYHLTVKIGGDTEVWLDFKTIKDKVETILKSGYDERNLGDMTLEDVAKKLVVQISDAIWDTEYPDRPMVTLEIMETDKHGLTISY